MLYRPPVAYPRRAPPIAHYLLNSEVRCTASISTLTFMKSTDFNEYSLK